MTFNCLVGTGIGDFEWS